MELYEDGLGTVGCDLFLAESSIPGAGLSIFSGRHFNADDVVLESSLSLKFGEDKSDLWDYGLILKHHPMLANLRGDVWRRGNGTMLLKASKEILPGNELLLSFEEHPASTSNSKLFSKIPRPEHYVLADEIIKDEINTQSGRTQRKSEEHTGGGSKWGDYVILLQFRSLLTHLLIDLSWRTKISAKNCCEACSKRCPTTTRRQVYARIHKVAR